MYTFTVADSRDQTNIEYSIFFNVQTTSIKDSYIAKVYSHSASLSWTGQKSGIDRVHRHFCGYSNFAGIKLLLQRNHMWTDEITRYTAPVFVTSEHCHSAEKAARTRYVSLSSMFCGFNEVICIEHLYVDGYVIFHAMVSVTRYSSGEFVA